jgi:predicted XRE-type DNA-binding protein
MSTTKKREEANRGFFEVMVSAYTMYSDMTKVLFEHHRVSDLINKSQVRHVADLQAFIDRLDGTKPGDPEVQSLISDVRRTIVHLNGLEQDLDQETTRFTDKLNSLRASIESLMVDIGHSLQAVENVVREDSDRKAVKSHTVPEVDTRTLVANRLKQLLIKRKVFQKDLAKATGVSQAYVSQVMNKKEVASSDFLQSAADFLTVDVTVFSFNVKHDTFLQVLGELSEVPADKK